MSRLLYKSIIVSAFVGMAAMKTNAQELEGLTKQKPFMLSGTVGVGIGTYSVSGIPSRTRNFSYLLSGSPVVTLYGISFPVGIVVSDQQRNFTQPFNQYGASPRYKWITAHAGWRSVQFSPYTLGGAVFLGGGVELNPGKLRLGFVYGRFNKAIEADSSHNTSAFYQVPSYKRTGYAVKVGFGTEENHIDCSYLKAKDDSNSVRKIDPLYNITPAENAVLGVSLRYRLLKHITLEAEGAGSIYTRDLASDTFSNEQLKDIKFITNLIRINASSQLTTAGQVAVGYEGSGYGLKLQYKRVDPNYQSMGAYYFETDVENYTVAPYFSLFKRRFTFNGSLGFQHDNILKDKSFRSNKTIGSVSMAYNAQQFGCSVQYGNYGISQDRGLNPVIDTLRVARTNHNVNAMLRVSLGGENLTHNFILVGNYQGLVDLNKYTAGASETNSKTGNLSYQLGLMPQGMNISAMYNYTVANASLMDIVIQGPSIGVDKQLAKSKVLLNTNWSYQMQRSNHENAGHFISGTLSGSFRFTKRNAVNAVLNYLQSSPGSTPDTPSFTELRTNLTYTYTF